ncbi:MAG: hypothetical protein QXU18_05410, partial [Thermoplasmatales archaeon]
YYREEQMHKELAKSGFTDHGGLFMKSKYSAEEKFQIVMESFSENVTQAEICRMPGIYPVQLAGGGKSSSRAVVQPRLRGGVQIRGMRR